MAITVDSQTESRIERQLASGRFHDPAEVMNSALDLLESDVWTTEDKSALDQLLAERILAAEQGNWISGDQVRTELNKLRIAQNG